MSHTSCRAHHDPLDRLPLPTLACTAAADLPWSPDRPLPPNLRPDVGLRIRLLCPHSLQNLLRSHVDPLYIYVGMRFLESFFQVLEQLFPMWGIDDQYFSIVRAARGYCERHDGSEPPRARHRMVLPPRRLAKMRALPGTPAGSYLKRASGT